MKTEIINCDRCGASIPDGPPNSWFKNTTVNYWSTAANVDRDLCANCNQDFQTFMANLPVATRIA